LQISYKQQDHVLTVFDNFSENVVVVAGTVNLGLWDNTGNYHLMFTNKIINLVSLFNVKDTWKTSYLFCLRSSLHSFAI
ncbi:hypothetical protein HN51_040109, partial [Arachis hypogaea]